MTITFGDLFCGCGGLSYGFSMHPSFRGTVAIDNNTTAGRVLEANHPELRFLEMDLQESNGVQEAVDALRGVNVLLGGAPCQGFSTLGKREDDDERSTLVDVFARIASKVSPALVIFENVPGITTKQHPSGVSYAEALVQQLGGAPRPYHAHGEVLHALDYGVPQTRKRWFLFAARSDLFSQGDLSALVTSVLTSKTSKRATLREAIGNLPQVGPGEGSETMTDSQGKTVYNHRAMNHTKRVRKRFSHVPPGGGLPDVPRELLTNHLKKMLDGEYGSGGHVQNIYGRMEWDEPSGTIVAGIDKITCGRFLHPEENRLLTPRECARIQCFPDSFRLQGSLVAQYYMIGNAVPPILSSVFANAAAGLFENTDLKRPASRPEAPQCQQNSRRSEAAFS